MRLFILGLCSIIVLATGCKDEKFIAPFEPQVYTSDLVGAWRTTLPYYYVNNGSAAQSYMLKDLRVSLILDAEKYWFEIGCYSDSLDFISLNRGFWMIVDGDPQILYFSTTEKSTDQKFKAPSDTLGMEVIKDRITSAEGDGSKILEEWGCDFEYSDNELKMYNFPVKLGLDTLELSRN
ncbi:MAG TPA: hypothetical protein VM123_11645 [archaeon]|nr:hypothetical protein [archaeon]